jgi:hypothetical protein
LSITTIYLIALLSLCFFALVYSYLAERRLLKRIDPVEFISIFMKVLLVTLIQVFFFFLPVLIGSIVRGSLYPWVENPLLYLLMGILSGIFGMIFIIQTVRIIKIHPDGKQMKYWAIILLLLHTITTALFFDLEAAYYFAAPLLLFLITLRISGRFWPVIIGVIGIFPLLSFDGILKATIILSLLGITVPVLTLISAVSILSLPFVFYFAGSICGNKSYSTAARTLS